MADLLKRDNQHLLLEKPYEKNNSFIAAINKLVRDFPHLVEIDKKFTLEDIELLTKLVKEEVDINIEVIANDLRKASYHGYRKLDIDLLTNFEEYSSRLTDEEKRVLWNDPSKQVYYDSMTVYFTDRSFITKDFSELVNNHHKLYNQFDSWVELKEKYGDTSYNIFPDTPIENHEIFRIWDTSVKGSTIDYIILHVAPQGQNQQYDSVFAGAKTYTPEFEWLDSTSVLAVIAHRINEIIHASDFIEAVGDQFVIDMTVLMNKAQEAASNSEAAKDLAEEYAQKAEAAVKKQQELTVSCTPLDVNRDPEVNYDSVKNHMTLGIPRSEVGLVTLSKFAINSANGHLSFHIKNEQDVDHVELDEATGNVIIVMKKV